MGKALYRTYRSRSLSEVVGQEHITTTLGNALQQGKIAHAYLLTGPRGVGKTSVARILAHEINHLSYSEKPHFDIIEIDAASNNGVEDVRDLRDKIMSAPSSATYKVFIIDEVHMLSKAAFNALLKTLEEPPAHVVFILATTEAHKLPETIISRTQRYRFKPVSLEKVAAHLRHIAKKEQISIDDEALHLIAEHGEGSFRDSISLLDQASSTSSNITREQIEQLLGHAPSTSITQLSDALKNQTVPATLAALHELSEQGYEPVMIALQLGQMLRSQFLDGNAPSYALDLLRDLLDVPPAHNPRALLEITLLKYAGYASPKLNETEVTEASQVKKVTPKPESTTVKTVQEKTSLQADKPAQAPETPTQADEPIVIDTPHPPTAERLSHDIAPQSSSPTTDNHNIDTLWQAVLQDLKQTHNTLYGIARMARPSLDGDTLTLELNFSFHQKRLNEPRNRSILAALVDSARGVPTEIRCLTSSAPKTALAGSETVAAISNIFGGAELLES
ncbi:DNA polymerase III subunit gamma/tau [Candidatus Saccharibacteria bacterium]|nr:MAG: DNA polymerase III subunit gamma/tau [Candidatus Saccharibacteria bacterium]